MKTIRIDEAIHTQLLKEAKQEGRTLQGHINIKLSGITMEQYKTSKGIERVIVEPVVVPDNDWTAKFESIGIKKGL